MGHMMGIHLPDIVNPKKNAAIYSIVQLLLTIPVVYAGRDFFIHGFKNLVRKSPTMDSLIAMGASAAIIYSLYATYMTITVDPEYHMNLYFEYRRMRNKKNDKYRSEINTILDKLKKNLVLLKFYKHTGELDSYVENIESFYEKIDVPRVADRPCSAVRLSRQRERCKRGS